MYYSFFFFYAIVLFFFLILLAFLWTIIVRAQLLSHVQLFANPWIVACQAPLPIGFSRQEYWSGLPFSPLGDLPDLGMQISPTGRQILYHLSHLGSPRFLLVFARFARGNAWMLSISKRLNKSKGREIGWR